MFLLDPDSYLDTQKGFEPKEGACDMTDEEFINELEVQRGLMVSVATGGPRIQEVNQEYIERRERIAGELRRKRS